jgi:hypothetical protein
VRFFFEGDGAAIEEPPNYARHEALAVRIEQMAGDLAQRDVRSGLHQGQDLRGVRLDPGRTPVAALPARLAAARCSPLTHELDDG